MLFRSPPSVDEAALALADLCTIIRSQNTMIHSDDVLRTWLDNLDRFLAIYTTGKGWVKAANYTASILGRGATCSQQLQAWGKNFSRDHSALPYCHQMIFSLVVFHLFSTQLHFTFLTPPFSFMFIFVIFSFSMPSRS